MHGRNLLPASLTPWASLLQAPFPKENISYAALSWELLDQEPTYSNTDFLVTHVPRKNPEESMEYSTIRKP